MTAVPKSPTTTTKKIADVIEMKRKKLGSACEVLPLLSADLPPFRAKN
jgi:hypothetical protein